MQRTSIMLPHKLKTRAIKLAKNQGVSLGELIRQSLEAACTRKKEQDPFFADNSFYDGEVPKDLSENHDDYLY